MNQYLCKHNETKEYIYPITRNSLIVKFECHLERPNQINLIYWKRFNENRKKTIKLESYDFEDMSNYYFCELTFEEPVRYLNYCFEVISNNEKRYYTPTGFKETQNGEYFEFQSTNELDIFTFPSWAEGITGYHIFPDRFHIGKESNQSFQNWENKPDRISSFGGNLQGISNKLDYLNELGIEVIFLTPIFTSNSNHKYDTVNYFEIDPSFGTLNDLQNLVDLAHKKQIKIVLDGVFNHIGYYSFQFQDVIKLGKESQYWNWFYINGDNIDTENVNYECVGDYKWMPKLRYSSPSLRAFILSVGTYWIKETNIDGWRLDVADEVDYTFWQEFRKATKSINQEILLIGETWHDGRDLLRGDQLDSVMNYLFRTNVIEYFIKRSIDKFDFQSRIEKLLFSYPIQVTNILYNLLGSHDTKRILTVCEGDLSIFKMVIGFQMTYPGMPIIYYGDEAGTEGETDPDCRTTMKWASINQDILRFYQKMIQLRKEHKELTIGDFKHLDLDESIYGFVRKYETASIITLFNTTESGESINLDISIFKSLNVPKKKEQNIKLFIESRAFRIIKIVEVDMEIRIENLI